VLGLHAVLLHFVEAAGVDHFQRVLLAFDNALLQAHEDLAVRQRRGIRAEDPPSLDIRGELGHAELQALKVGGGGHSAVGGGQVTGPAAPPIEDQGSAFLGEGLDDLLANGPPQHVVQVLVVPKHERRLDGPEFGQVPADGRRASQHHIHAADGQAFGQFLIVAQLGAGVELDVDTALSLLFH
jgi:hypothetical protein